MEADPAYPPPAPGGLNVTYDTLNGTATLTWMPVNVSDLAGYIIFRNDTSSTDPQRISSALIKDTVYVDTVFKNRMDSRDLAMAYRLKAQDTDANQSTVFSKAVSIEVPSPTQVRTFFSFQLLNTIADSASISDTVAAIATYSNKTRKNVRISWYVDTKESAVRTVDVSSLSGVDTLKRAWAVASKHKLFVSMVDDGGAIWWDSTAIKIVQDAPIIVYISPDTVVEHNGTVKCSVYVTQSFGTLTVEIDTANSGGYIVIPNNGTSAAYNFQTGLASSWDSVKVRVTDDDSNVVYGGFKVDIRPRAMVLTSTDSNYNSVTINFNQTLETDFAQLRIYRDTVADVDSSDALWTTSSNSGATSYTSTDDEGYVYRRYYYRAYQTDNEGLTGAGSNVVNTRIKNSAPAVPTITNPSSDSAYIWANNYLRWSAVTDPNGHDVNYRVILVDSAGVSKNRELAANLTTPFFHLMEFEKENVLLTCKVGAYDALGDTSWSMRVFNVKSLYDTITDADGNVYTTKVIGNQVWTVENLRTTKYNDGTSIAHVTDYTQWEALKTSAYSYHNNDSIANAGKYGALYNWYAVNTGNLAPAGWRVPTDADWTELEEYLIANGYNWDGTKEGNKIAKSMATQTDWPGIRFAGAIGNDPTKNNSSGFSALPGGFRFYNGFKASGGDGYWWSATETDVDYAWYRYLRYGGESLYSFSYYGKSCGFSVRLLRDLD